ncbi:MAG: ThuA domain-containing protein [Verrucomicrobiae bacterium]|nr:ThuA domain-containing protein [Verrucomicrobiae bacterium]
MKSTWELVMKSKFFSRLVRLVAAFSVALFACANGAEKRVLVVSVTKGFRHDVIPTVDKVVADLAQQSGKFTVDYVKTEQEMAEKMAPAALANYDAVVFNNTTGDLPLPDRQGFLDWIKSGKGFVGFHAATDTFAGFPAYIDMIGGQFQVHYEQVEVEVLVEDPSHPATRHFGKSFRAFDEIYLLKNFDRRKVHGLLTLDKHPNFGFPGDYPIAWCKEYGNGRVIYTSLGHRKEIAERPDIKPPDLGAML